MTDDRGSVYEGDKEGNNGSLALPLLVEQVTADLQVTLVTAPTEVGTGRGFTVGWTVQNLGPARTNVRHWRDEVFLSTDAVIDGGDTALGTVYRSGALDPLERYSVSQTFPGAGAGSQRTLRGRPHR